MPPSFRGVDVPATVRVQTAAPLSAAAVDAVSGASVTWAFGDGQTATGATVWHTYAAAQADRSRRRRGRLDRAQLPGRRMPDDDEAHGARRHGREDPEPDQVHPWRASEREGREGDPHRSRRADRARVRVDDAPRWHWGAACRDPLSTPGPARVARVLTAHLRRDAATAAAPAGCDARVVP
jgi:hypothetical protein